MLQLNQDIEQDEPRNFRHPVGSPISITSSPPGNSVNKIVLCNLASLIPSSSIPCKLRLAEQLFTGNWMQFSSPIEHNSLQSLSKSPNFTGLSPTTSNNLAGLAAILHPQVANAGKSLPIGNDQARINHLEQLLSGANSSQGSSFQQSSSFPEPKLSHFHGSLPSFGPSTSSGSRVETLSGPQFLWGSPKPHVENGISSGWTRPAAGHQFAGKGQVFPLSGHHGSLLGSSNQHSHHVGSAPSGVPLDRRFNYFPESPDTSILNHAVYGSMGLGRNDGKLLQNVVPRSSISAGFSMPGNMSENSSLNFKMMSSPRLSPVFLGNNGLYPGLQPPGIDGIAEHGRSKRVENNGNLVDSKKQFQLDLDKIIRGEDTRTTLMIKNIPNK